MKAGAEQMYLLIRKFLQIHLPVRRGSSPNTVRSYRASITQLIDYLTDVRGMRAEDIGFDDLTEESIAGFLDHLEEKGCSVSTRNQRLASIRAFLSFAAQEDIACMAVLARAQRVPKKKTVNRVVGYLTEEQLAVLLRQPDQSKPKGRRDTLLLSLMYDTAARASEIVGLTLKDLHLSSPCPYVVLRGKGGKVRSVPLMQATVDHVRSHISEFHGGSLPDAPLVFTTIHGIRCAMSYENVSKLVARYGAAAKEECPGFPDHLHAHMLRHTRALHLYQDGLPLSYVKEVLGHSNINTTGIYATADVGMLRKAMEPLDIELPTAAAVPSWKSEKERLMGLAGLR